MGSRAIHWLRASALRLGDALLRLPAHRALPLFVALLAAFTLLKLLAIAWSPLLLSGDEAHYWEWSRRLDWAYYSKGPVVALLIAAGTALFGDTELGVRFPAVVLGSLLSVALFAFAWRLAGAGLAFASVVLLSSGLLFHTLGLGMTTDAPVLLFWTLATWCAYEALFRGKPVAWLGWGLALGLATLSKYTAGIVFPAVLLFLLINPRLRPALFRPPFWAGTVVYGLCLLPVAWWNLEHGWVNLAHNAGHVSSGLTDGLRLRYVPELLGAQLGLVGPVLFPMLVWSCWRAAKAYRHDGDDVAGLLLAPVVPLALLCVGVALTKRVYANWPAPLYVNAVLLLAWILARDADLAYRVRTALGSALLCNLVLLLPTYPLALGSRMGLPPERLPSKKLIGWDQLGRYVDGVRTQWAADGRPLSFVTNDRYGILSAISFYSEDRPPVYCAQIGGRRMNQYDVWGGWETQRGNDALIVLSQDAVHPDLANRFRVITPAAPPLEIRYDGGPLRTFYFFAGLGFDGRPPAPPTSY